MNDRNSHVQWVRRTNGKGLRRAVVRGVNENRIADFIGAATADVIAMATVPIDCSESAKPCRATWTGATVADG
jgi:hypothetical protein